MFPFVPRFHLSLLSAGVVAAMLASSVPTLRAQSSALPERFVGLAVGLSRPTGGAETIEILIERWSTDAERKRLVDVIRTGETHDILETLTDFKRVGMLRTPETVGYPLNFSRHRLMPDKIEQITLLTDRPITFWGPSTLDYPFTLVELRIGPDGKGEGRLSLAAKVTVDEKAGTLVLENYYALPVHLTGVRRERNE
jgi:hypothetical protein